MNKPKKKPMLKLYVWDDFAPDYTSGLAFAITANGAKSKSSHSANASLSSATAALSHAALRTPLNI